MSEDNSIATKKTGRPKKALADKTPQEAIFIMAKFGATQEEIADEMGISTVTLLNRKDLYECWKAGHSEMKLSLRQLQFKSAASGNTAMQIWLANNTLTREISRNHIDGIRSRMQTGHQWYNRNCLRQRQLLKYNSAAIRNTHNAAVVCIPHSTSYSSHGNALDKKNDRYFPEKICIRVRRDPALHLDRKLR